MNDPIQQMIQAKTVLAPMAGVTDVPFRMLMRRFGCKFAFTEMIDVNGVIYNNRKTFRLMERLPGDAPLGIQLVGRDEDKFSRVAAYCVEKGYRVIDINAGCPARKVVSPGKGVSLMRAPAVLSRIVRRLVRELGVPVTVKMRSGWNEEEKNYMEVAEAVQDAGASAVCVHARTKEQMYKGRADHRITAEMKRNLRIPVFASGNLMSPRDVKDVLDLTGCDGVFIARGCLGRPWIFSQTNRMLRGMEPIDPPGFEDIKEIMLEHFQLASEYFESSRLFPRMYKHVAWYFKGHKNLDPVMRSYRQVDSLDGLRRFVESVKVGERNRLEVSGGFPAQGTI
ncbi:MAG: tRNA dihydrouridine synthase DusB [Candidatus Omnitrophica bacterium]|nr:tRNA dihydrouridine synthase DusB [Candidatus Omnitrophota bacterium]